MKDLKKLAVIVLVAISFFATGFAFADEKREIELVVLGCTLQINNIDLHIDNLNLQKQVIDIQKAWLQENARVLKSLDKIEEINNSIVPRKKSPSPGLWTEKSECDYQQTVAEIERNKKELFARKVDAEKSLRQAELLLKKSEGGRKK